MFFFVFLWPTNLTVQIQSSRPGENDGRALPEGVDMDPSAPPPTRDSIGNVLGENGCSRTFLSLFDLFLGYVAMSARTRPRGTPAAGKRHPREEDVAEETRGRQPRTGPMDGPGDACCGLPPGKPLPAAEGWDGEGLGPPVANEVAGDVFHGGNPCQMRLCGQPSQTRPLDGPGGRPRRAPLRVAGGQGCVWRKRGRGEWEMAIVDEIPRTAIGNKVFGGP